MANKHMTPEEFRQRGYAVIDWIARYMENVADYPVLSQVQPGAIRERLPAQPPDEGEPFEAVLGDLDEVIMPGITHWQSPNFFAYYPSNSSGPAILGDLLSSGLSVQGMLWTTSPACTELEQHVLDWLVTMLGLPEHFSSRTAGGGVIQDTASSAVLCALLAARERTTQGDSNKSGVRQPLVAYTSTQAHSSIEKAIRIAGLGSEQLRAIPVDDKHAMRPVALAEAIRSDRAAGRIPCFVNATIGTTSSSAIDPLPAIADICAREGVWLHVDAAYAGPATVCPELRWIQDGVERADSYSCNPHKWLLTTFDCNLLYLKERAPLINALSILPEYLKNAATASGAVVDYRDWQMPLGRRFRALKLWLVIRHYGVAGLREHIRGHVAAAQWFAARIDEDARFERVAPAPLSLVCFRHVGGDDSNRMLLDRLNESGQLFLTHTRLHDQLVMRLAVGATTTEQAHVERAWQLIDRFTDELG